MKWILDECHVILSNRLNVQEIIPYMNKEHLLTLTDEETLSSPNIIVTTKDKISHIKQLLQRKDGKALEKFVRCLKQSQDNTAHSDIINHLKRARDERSKSNMIVVV